MQERSHRQLQALSATDSKRKAACEAECTSGKSQSGLLDKPLGLVTLVNLTSRWARRYGTSYPQLFVPLYPSRCRALEGRAGRVSVNAKEQVASLQKNPYNFCLNSMKLNALISFVCEN